MDIKEQENTYEGFVNATKYGVIAGVVLMLVLLAVYIL